MELRQLEYFVTVANLGSINKAAEVLFTSQPNVSKIINSFERHVGIELFTRNSKGVRLTEKGQEIYDYAKIIITNADMMTSIVNRKIDSVLNVSCYPSKMISRVMCDYYKEYGDYETKIKFYEGTVEEIVESVKNNSTEIGIVYIVENQKCCLKNTLEHKKMEFIIMGKKPLCIYAGKNNKFYNRQSVKLNELGNFKFVQLERDYFSMYQYLDKLKIFKNDVRDFNDIVTTNSDHLVVDFLLNTELCSFGIKLINPKYAQYDIKAIDIEDYNDKLLIGYVKRKGEKLSKEANNFIELLKVIIDHK